MRRVISIAAFVVFALTAHETAAQDDEQSQGAELASAAAIGPDAVEGPSVPEVPKDEPAEGGACDMRPYSMQISVLGVRESRGTITVDVHDDDPTKFLKSGGKLARLRVPAVQGETRFCITVAKAGVYALAIYHDRNANTKLDKNFIGLPSEPFGLSNNPPLRLAMPKHRDSAFEVNGPRTPVVIDLNK